METVCGEYIGLYVYRSTHLDETFLIILFWNSVKSFTRIHPRPVSERVETFRPGGVIKPRQWPHFIFTH